MRILSSLWPVAFASLVLPALPAIGAAQQAPATPATGASRPSFKKQPQEVVLPVTVQDKHGNLVPNLTATDFTLTEDGRPQTIKSFSAGSNVPMQLGLLVDTSRTVEPALASARAAAEKFVAQMIPAEPKDPKSGNRAFLIHFDTEVELLQDFTNSREKLDRELEQMGPSSAEHNNPQGPETSDSGGYGGQRAGHGGTEVYDAIYLAADELMKPKSGIKTLIVFSDGVDRSSKETQSDAIDAAEHAGTVVYCVYFRGGDRRDSGFPGMGRGDNYPGGYPGGPGGYPGGPGGYPGGPGYPGGYPGDPYPGGGRTPQATIDGKKVMQDIANRTGGQFFEAKHTANLEEIYNQIAKELQGQYVLTYTPDQTDTEGGYHKVVLKPKRDGLTVVSRQGYYAPGGDNR